MMKKTEGVFPSSDGINSIKYYLFVPEGSPKAIIQICHGMWEHMGRYETNGLVRALTDNGIAVCGNDHIGHGMTADGGELGHFTDCKHLTDDLDAVRAQVRKRYPHLPYILLGHGFGALLAREYAVRHGNIDGLVLVGTTAGDTPLGNARLASSLISALRGRKHYSPMLKRLVVGKLNDRFRNENDTLSFRSSLPDVRSSLRYDGKCSFEYTVSSYKAVLDLAQSVCCSAWVEQVPLSLPIYLMWGEDDPATENGEGARQLYTSLEDREINELSFDSFKGRHDVFSDIDSKISVEKLIKWTDKVIEGVVACRSYGTIPFGKVDF